MNDSTTDSTTDTATTDVVVIGGGQSGLAAARALNDRGVRPLVLEARSEPVGSWPRYYDSLHIFSPARHSGMPGLEFPGEPDRYPHRDEVVAYLRRYAEDIDAELRVDTRVTAVLPHDVQGFVVHTAHGQPIHAAAVVAATGSFGNPYVPALPGQDSFIGRTLHVADYRRPDDHAGERIIVVGAGNSAVQAGYELAAVADVSLAAQGATTFVPQQLNGRDLHDWLTSTGFDDLPGEWLMRHLGGNFVVDTGDYRTAMETGRLNRRPMFSAFTPDGVVWADGTHERVDTVVFATGYRPHVSYLAPLGALDADRLPRHVGGISTTHPGLVYLGLELQRSFSSNTLRGVHRDAEHVVPILLAHLRGAVAAVGLPSASPGR